MSNHTYNDVVCSRYYNITAYDKIRISLYFYENARQIYLFLVETRLFKGPRNYLGF